MRTEHWEQCPANEDHYLYGPFSECRCAQIESDAREAWMDMLIDLDCEDRA